MDSSVFYYKITSFLETTERGCWPTKRRAYDLCRIIGFGSTAIVHEAYCKPRKERCAIKQINVQYPERKLKALKEIMIMKTCNHENIVKFYTSFMVDNEIWLVTNLSECGSLRDIIRHKMILHDFKDGVLDEETVATVLKQILKGLEYLHNNQIIHRDIKASNILINKNGSVQLADFGLSSILPTIESISQLKTFHLLAGTPSWMAPEIMQKKSGYDFKADIWSFGITAIEIITGDVPYLTFLPDEIIKLTLENDPPTLDANCHEKSGYNKYGNLVREMIACCLQKDPAKRPTAAELLEHPFFRKAKDNEFLLKRLSIWAPSLGLEIQSIVNAQLWYLKSKTKRRESLFMTERLTQSLSEEKEIFGTGKHLSKKNTNFKSQLAALCLEKYGESSTSQEYYTCQTVPITLPLIATYPSLPQRKGFPKKKLWKFLKKLGTSNS